MTGPYEAAAHDLRRKGWSPIPMAAKSDGIPTGWGAGYATAMASGADVQGWLDEGRGGDNVAGRCPPEVVGLDIDAHVKDKNAHGTLARLVAEHGPLPRTFVVSSRFGPGWDGLSGIRLYRLPEQHAARAADPSAGWRGGWPGVDVVRHAHRYVMAPPSVHPEKGTAYRVLDEVTGSYLDALPAVADLPLLPEPWCAALYHGGDGRQRQDDPQSAYWTEGRPCPAVRARLGQAVAELESGRHDNTAAALMALTRLGEQGHAGVRRAVDVLLGTFVEAVTTAGSGRRSASAARTEWARLVVDLDAKLAAKGLTDPLDVGCCGDTDPPAADDDQPGHRRVVLTPASAIRPRRVEWMWEGRLAVGTLALLAGPEGLGKSTVAYTLAAQVTRGTLPGEHYGKPRSVLVAAAEDSWAHTIVPRLMAAGADLDRVYRVEVVTSDDLRVPLTLPRDLAGLRAHAAEVDAAMLLLDPLISRLDDRLDSHRDAETRRALEPLAKLADDARLVVLGLIHHNKSGSGDPLTLVMGSKAFTSVARSVHTVVKDPDDDTERGRLFGTPKNNLGPTDLPVLRFTIDGHVIDTDDGPATTGRLTWGGEAAGSIGDAVRRSGESADDRSATAEAADWLADWLAVEGGRALSSDIKAAAAKAGHNVEALKRARRRIGVEVESVGYPRRTYWALPKGTAEGGAQSGHPQSGHSRVKSGESPNPDLTDPTERQSGQSGQSGQSEGVLGDLTPPDDPTGWEWPAGSVGEAVVPS